MASTHGHGNPDWTREETILALDLYLTFKGSIPSGRDSRILELSSVLRKMPYHEMASRKESFRNPDGVVFKLLNLHQVATGKGLSNVSKMDKKIWAEFAADPSEVQRIASLIRRGITTAESEGLMDYDGEEEFYEGRIQTILHKKRERNPKLRKLLLNARKNAGKLACEMCNTKSMCQDPKNEDAIFEVHHLVPISLAIERKTKLNDLVLLCANCHRILHRVIFIEKRWLNISEGKKLIYTSQILGGND